MPISVQTATRRNSTFNQLMAQSTPFPNTNPRTKIGAGNQWNRADMNGNAIEATKGKAMLFRPQTDPSVNSLYSGTYPNPYSNSTEWWNNPALRNELYIINATFGYQTEGTDSYAKYYKRYYPISSTIRTATITGIARDEREYEDLTYWIRVAQSDIARGYIDYIGLLVPEAAINAWGFIPSIEIMLGSMPGNSPNPIPVGIQYQFDFIITVDNTDATDNFVSPNNFGWTAKTPPLSGISWTSLTTGLPMYSANIPINYSLSTLVPDRPSVPHSGYTSIRI